MIADESKLAGLGAYAGLSAIAPETTSPTNLGLPFNEVIGQAMEQANKERGQTPGEGEGGELTKALPKPSPGAVIPSAFKTQDAAVDNPGSLSDSNQQLFLASETASDPLAVPANPPRLENGYQPTAVPPNQTDGLREKITSRRIPSEVQNCTSDLPASTMTASVAATEPITKTEPPIQPGEWPTKTDKKTPPQLGIADATMMACMVMAFPIPLTPVVLAQNTEVPSPEPPTVDSVSNQKSDPTVTPLPVVYSSPMQSLPSSPKAPSGCRYPTTELGVPQPEGISTALGIALPAPNSKLETQTVLKADQPTNVAEPVTATEPVALPIVQPEPSVSKFIPSTNSVKETDARIAFKEPADNQEQDAAGMSETIQKSDPLAAATLADNSARKPVPQPLAATTKSLLADSADWVDQDQIETEIFHQSAPNLTNLQAQKGVPQFDTSECSAKATSASEAPESAPASRPPSPLPEVQKKLIETIAANLAQKFSATTGQGQGAESEVYPPALIPLDVTKPSAIKSLSDIPTVEATQCGQPTRRVEIRYLSQIINYPTLESVSPATSPLATRAVKAIELIPTPGVTGLSAQVSSVSEKRTTPFVSSEVNPSLPSANSKPSQSARQYAGQVSDTFASPISLPNIETNGEQPLPFSAQNVTASPSPGPLPTKSVPPPNPTQMLEVTASPVQGSLVSPTALPASNAHTPTQSVLTPDLNRNKTGQIPDQTQARLVPTDSMDAEAVPPDLMQNQNPAVEANSSLPDGSIVRTSLKDSETAEGLKGNQDGDISGTSNARLPNVMKQTEKLENATERAEQNLPLKNSGSIVLEPKTILGRRRSVVSENGTPDCPSNRLTADFSTKAARFAAELEPVIATPKESSLAAPLVERTHQMILEGVMRFKQMDADSLSVVFKPDSHTEMVLNLKLHGNGIEVRADLNSGDFSNLNQHWQELQDRLAQQGVKLSPLGSNHEINLSQGGGSNLPQHSQSRQEASQIHTQPSPHLTPREPRPTVAALPHKRVKGWESWA